MSARDRMKRILTDFIDPTSFATRSKSLAERERAVRIREHNIAGKEKGIYQSKLWANMVTGDFNPDKIGIPTYKKMVYYDAQVISGLDILQMAIAVPWKIVHPDKEVVDFITWSLNRLRRPTFNESIVQIMSAIWAGFSVTETVWEYVPDQKKYSLRQELELKTLDPESITFFSKQSGQLISIQQEIDNEYISLDMRKQLVYTWNKQFGNWYGESILKAIYKNWFIKDNMLKFANIAFERFGAPIMLGISRDVKSMDDVEDVLSHLYARSVGVIHKRTKDDPTDIKILESKRATMPFMDYINYHNRMILARMLIGEPLLKGGGGVYGPRVPYSILNTRLNGIRNGISGALSYLMDLFTTVNFDTDEPAKIVFEEPIEEDLKQKKDDALKADVDMDEELSNRKKQVEDEKSNDNGDDE